MNSPIAIKEIEFIILRLMKKKSPGPNGFKGAFKEELTLILQFLPGNRKGGNTSQLIFIRPVLP